jgi:glycyl-tRNA synthetase beta chain
MANNTAKTPASATLLVELLTEELPPKALKRLGQEFALKISEGLASSGLVDLVVDSAFFATPRRLAVRVPNVRERAPDTEREVQGPSVSAPEQAVAGFAKKCGMAIEALKKQQTSKGEVYVARVTTVGQKLADVLASKIEAALKALPIPKVMRWGDGDAQFVRPVHGLVMMHGSRVVPGEVLGLESGNQTLGHRFLSGGRITIKNADSYEQILLKSGKVVADFSARRSEIVNKITYLCDDSRVPIASDGLYDEITALVEAPAVYEGQFSAEFLEVPEECLILSMQQHQKYVPLRDRKTGKLLPRFLFVSNIETKQPREIIHGNERVLRARLSDAKFFYDQDRKSRLETRVPRLAGVVYHNKLGTQLERVERIKALAGKIAGELKADVKAAERAALLCKADLLTDMVGEFPELQGVMGRYYALSDGEPKDIADAIEAHYRPRFAGDELPQGNVAIAVALADKLYSLAGLFGIKQTPTGDRDPFGLRRAALGVIRILIERDLPLSVHDLVNEAFAVYDGKIGDAHTDLEMFILDRLSGYLRDRGYSALEVDSVLGVRHLRINDAVRQLEAVRAFNKLPEAQSLAAANKRVVNILKQAEAKGEKISSVGIAALKEPAERALFEALETASQKATPLFKQGDFTGYLKAFAILKAPVDAFFDSIMVMVEDSELRKSRLALLADLREQMNRVADISKLAT